MTDLPLVAGVDLGTTIDRRCAGRPRNRTRARACECSESRNSRYGADVLSRLSAALEATLMSYAS